MEEKDIEVNGKKLKVTVSLPKEYIEDNNLKIFLDDTIDLGEVVSEINNSEIKEDTNEIDINEQK